MHSCSRHCPYPPSPSPHSNTRPLPYIHFIPIFHLSDKSTVFQERPLLKSQA